MPEPPGAITRPNSSKTYATPTRSTAMIAAGDACAGDRPAVWTRCVTVPSSAAAVASAPTDPSEETSTRTVLVWKPAVCRLFAAACAASSFRSASRIVVPTPTRRAMAWPIEPAPMTTRDLGCFGCAHITSFSSWVNDRSWLQGRGASEPFRLWSRASGGGSPCCSGVWQDPPRPHRQADSAAILTL
jgi:hypothetical protein